MDVSIFVVCWICLSFFLTVSELGHPGLFYFLAAGCAALLTGISAVYVETLTAQISIFLVSFLLFFYLFRRYVSRRLNRQAGVRTNMYALVGKHAYVIMPIMPGKMGQIKVNGEIWSARSVKEEMAELGVEKLVEIVQVSGCHCIVKLLMKKG